MTITITEVTEEDINKIMAEYDRKGRLLGFKNGDAMENFKVNASLGMIKFGGSFMHDLGHALAHADSNNTFKIIGTFRKECEEHYQLYLKWLSKRFKSNNEEETP